MVQHGQRCKLALPRYTAISHPEVKAWQVCRDYLKWKPIKPACETEVNYQDITALGNPK